MSQGAQTPSADAREASMSRVTTLDAVLAKAAPQETKEPEEAKKEDEPKPKKTFNERISEVIAERNAARDQAAREKAEKDELRAKLEALSTKAEPTQPGDKPERSKFGSDDDYVEALAEWKANQAIAKREKEQAEAQARAEFETIERNWTKQCEAAKAEMEDFEEVVGEAEIPIPDVAAAALKESKHGAKLLYFLAKHQDEARALSRMRPIAAVQYLRDLERELIEPEPVEKAKPVERSRAPEPTNPIKQTPANDARRPGESFSEYKARRKSEK